MYYNRKTQMEELAIIYFLHFGQPKAPLENRYLIPIEHNADAAGIYNTLCLFEENNLEDLLSQKNECFLKYLLADYTLKENNLISPFEKLLKAYQPLDKEKKIIHIMQGFILDYLDALDPYTLLSYGLPVDQDLFLEVQNRHNKNFESIKDVKQYIKKL